jgi:thiosulfate/3-mercaptopyruvate sulfurtransferase
MLNRRLNISEEKLKSGIWALAEQRLTRRSVLALAAAFAAACARDGQSAGETNTDRALLTPTYLSSDLLVGPEWLKDRLDDPALRLFDLSELADYRDGHIPGARHFWWQDLIEIHNPVYGMLLGPDERQIVMREAGVAPDSIVVCYDRSGGIYASRLIWVLRYMGFAKSYLLVGGLQGWRETGGTVTNAGATSPHPGGIGDIRDESINANADGIRNRLDDPDLVVLDTRTRDELEETWRGQLRRGLIPRSRWLPRDRFLTDGPVPALISPETLEERLAGAGVDLGATTEIIVYGLHATLASLPWLALTALGGMHVRLYDGSWADWGSRDDLPIAPLPEFD